MRMPATPAMVGRQQPGLWEGTRNPGLDCHALAQGPTVDDQQRHFVLGINLQVLGRRVLAFFEIERTNLKLRASFGERNVRRQCAGDRGVVKGDFHKTLRLPL